MELSIVIVNWNSCSFLRNCLDSILAARVSISFDITVIDSGSFDGSALLIAQSYPSVRFIQSADNLGFARANNLAAEAASGDCLLFLNPDTEVIGSAIDELFVALNTLPAAGIVGATLLDTSGSLQSTCIRSIPTILSKVLDSTLLRQLWPRATLWGAGALWEDETVPWRVEAVSGACLMMRSDTFRRLGGFSEDYFMYAEDMDLAYKSLSAGYTNYYVPIAKVTHHGGGSSAESGSAFGAVMIPEATWRFFNKTRGYSYALSYRIAMCIAAMGRLGVLTLATPLWIAVGGKSSWRRSVRKWIAVLRWSLGLDDLVKRYYPDERRT